MNGYIKLILENKNKINKIEYNNEEKYKKLRKDIIEILSTDYLQSINFINRFHDFDYLEYHDKITNDEIKILISELEDIIVNYYYINSKPTKIKTLYTYEDYYNWEIKKLQLKSKNHYFHETDILYLNFYTNKRTNKLDVTFYDKRYTFKTHKEVLQNINLKKEQEINSTIEKFNKRMEQKYKTYKCYKKEY